MRLMVIDRDRNNARLVEERLQPFGYEIVCEPSKNEALERLTAEPFDLVLVDPAPLATARPFVISLRRALRRQYVFVALMAYEGTRSDAIKTGMNDALPKPLDPDRLPVTVDNARRMGELMARLADESYDYPNANGILGKSAMNQLFLTSLDRADRYGEESFLMFVTLKNYTALSAQIGEDEVEEMVHGLGNYLGKVRRQSDIAGRIGAHEFCSLILRPVRETEPQDAITRFAEILKRDRAELAVNGVIPELELRLMNVPTGEIQARFEIV